MTNTFLAAIVKRLAYNFRGQHDDGQIRNFGHIHDGRIGRKAADDFLCGMNRKYFSFKSQGLQRGKHD